MSVELKTLAMKARVYNQIRKFFYKKRVEGFTVEQKVEFFDNLFKENYLTHWELINYKRKRQDKKKLYEERVTRGYKFKKKTSKKDYESGKYNKTL